jgi:hypothetical protein
MRWAGEMGAEAARTVRRRGGGVFAAGPGRGRPRHRPRLQPAGLHPHVPLLHGAQGAGQAGAAPRPVRPRGPAAPRATCTPSTTSSPRRCTVFATPTTTGPAPRPSRCWPTSGCRRWRSTPSTTRSCRPPRCPRARGRPRHALAAGAGRPRGLSGVAGPAGAARPCARHARGRGPGCWPICLRSCPWTTSSRPRWPNGPTCRTAMAGSGWTRAATGTCATTAARRGPFAAEAGRGGGTRQGLALLHDKLIAFIHRNYAGRRVGSVVLPERPAARVRRAGSHAHIWRLQPTGRCWRTPGSGAGEVQRCLLDEQGACTWSDRPGPGSGAHQRHGAGGRARSSKGSGCPTGESGRPAAALGPLCAARSGGWGLAPGRPELERAMKKAGRVTGFSSEGASAYLTVASMYSTAALISASEAAMEPPLGGIAPLPLMTLAVRPSTPRPTRATRRPCRPAWAHRPHRRRGTPCRPACTGPHRRQRRPRAWRRPGLRRAAAGRRRHHRRGRGGFSGAAVAAGAALRRRPVPGARRTCRRRRWPCAPRRGRSRSR